MKNHTLVMREVDRRIFEKVVIGEKTIETRAASPKYQAIKAAETLTFKCGSDSILKKILKIDHFASIEEMFNQLPMQLILPGVNNIEDAKRIYQSFPGYKEKIASNGILAFTLEP